MIQKYVLPKIETMQDVNTVLKEIAVNMDLNLNATAKIKLRDLIQYLDNTVI